MLCTEIYNEEDREKIFEAFHKLTDVETKRQFLLSRVTRNAKKRTRKRNTQKEIQPRNRAFSY